MINKTHRKRIFPFIMNLRWIYITSPPTLSTIWITWIWWWQEQNIYLVLLEECLEASRETTLNTRKMMLVLKTSVLNTFCGTSKLLYYPEITLRAMAGKYKRFLDRTMEGVVILKYKSTLASWKLYLTTNWNYFINDYRHKLYLGHLSLKTNMW